MNQKNHTDYAYYSKTLKQVFDSVEELKQAEAAYFAELKAKEDKAAAKKADAVRVEEAFKALNTARRAYKENLATLTKEYSEAMAELKKTYDFGKADIQAKLAAAEDVYAKALKSFTEKYPEGYHLTLKDGDFETTISSQITTTDNKKDAEVKVANIFDLLFG